VLRLQQPIEKRDAVGGQQLAELGVAGILACLRLRQIGRIGGRAAQPVQLVEIVERRRGSRTRVAIVMPQQDLQRHLDARLPVAQVERHVQRVR